METTGLPPLLHGFLNVLKQRLIVKAQEDAVLWPRALTAPRRVEIPLTRALRTASGLTYAELKLELPDAATPRSLGVNGDTRLLGIGLRSFTVR